VVTFVADYETENFLNTVQLAHTIPSIRKRSTVDLRASIRLFMHENKMLEVYSVVGIATLGDELFVLRWGYPYMQVFKPLVNMNCRRNLDVGSVECHGLAACEFNQCLYASVQYPATIYKVSPVTNNVVRRWSTNGQPGGLSVNSVHNLLVACCYTHKVQEFTTDGAMVREIDLQPSGITYPVHVVQLPDRNFGITHHGSEHGYSVVGSDGKIVKSAQGPAGDAAGQMRSPRGFAVSKSKVFVADHGNNRLLLLNSESMSFEQLPPSFNVGFDDPYCIHFDASAGVMYVGESGGRVFCFKK